MRAPQGINVDWLPAHLVSCPRNKRYFVAIKMGRRQGGVGEASPLCFFPRVQSEDASPTSQDLGCFPAAGDSETGTPEGEVLQRGCSVQLRNLRPLVYPPPTDVANQSPNCGAPGLGAGYTTKNHPKCSGENRRSSSSKPLKC